MVEGRKPPRASKTNTTPALSKSRTTISLSPRVEETICPSSTFELELCVVAGVGLSVACSTVSFVELVMLAGSWTGTVFSLSIE